MLLVRSWGIDLYVFWLSKVLALLIYSCLNIMTIATPLSAVRTIWSLSFLSSLTAMLCTLVKLGLGVERLLEPDLYWP